MGKILEFKEDKKKEINIFLHERIKYAYRDEVYLYYIFSEDYVRQGWKIHISVTTKNYQEVLDKCSRYLVKSKISFKYIFNKKTLLKYLSADISKKSLGKFITIYPKQDNVVGVIKDLGNILGEEESVVVLSDRRYRKTNIYYRYGNIDDNSDYLVSPKGELVKDNRDYYELPYFISDIFEEDSDEELFPDHIKPYSILYQSAGGDIFLAKCDSRDVIVKEARLNVISSAFGDVIADLKNEERLLLELKKNYKFPNVIESFSCFGNYYLVEECAMGETLSIVVTKEDFKESVSLKKLFLELLSIVTDAHKKDIILNDINSNNFIIDYKGALTAKFCDLGSSYKKGEKINPERNKEGVADIFYNNYNFFDERSDFQKLGFLFMNIIAPLNYLLRCDNSGESSLSKLKVMLIDFLEIYEAISYLILERNFDYKEFISLMEKIPADIHVKDIEKSLYKNLTIEKMLLIIDEKNKEYEKFLSRFCNQDLNMRHVDKLENFIEDIRIQESIRYLKQYKKSGEDKFLDYYFDIMKRIEDEISYYKGVYILGEEEMYIPYINEGIGGVILSKILCYKLIKNRDILRDLDRYINSLLVEDMICKVGLIPGGLGIIAILYDYYLITKDNTVLKKSLRLLCVLFLFDVKLEDMSLIPNHTYSNIDNSFENGISGYIYVLNKILNKEEIFYGCFFEE